MKRLVEICPSTTHCIFQRFKATGSVDPAKQPPARYDCGKLDDHHELLIIALLIENPCLYLHEICELIKEASNLEVSASTVCRIIHKNGFTRKKVQTIAKQRSIDYRAQFQAQCHFVWVDETGSDARDHIRKFGYQFQGIAPTYHRFLDRGKRISAIAAISDEGLVAVELIQGTVNSNFFSDFVRGTLIPEMEAFDGSVKKSVVIMDNSSCCKSQEIIE